MFSQFIYNKFIKNLTLRFCSVKINCIQIILKCRQGRIFFTFFKERFYNGVSRIKNLKYLPPLSVCEISTTGCSRYRATIEALYYNSIYYYNAKIGWNRRVIFYPAPFSYEELVQGFYM